MDLKSLAKEAMKPGGVFPVCPACGKPFMKAVNTKDRSAQKILSDHVNPLHEVGTTCCSGCGHIYMANRTTGFSRPLTSVERKRLVASRAGPEFREFRERVVSRLIG